MTIFDLMTMLRENNIHFTLSSHRDDALMAIASVPGERWEIEIFPDGHVEFERFVSNGGMLDEAQLLGLIPSFKD